MFSPYGPLECTSAQSRRRAPAYAAAYRASRASHDSGGSPTAALAAFCERRNCVAAAGRGRRLAPTWTWPQQSRNPTTRSREKGTLEFTMTEFVFLWRCNNVLYLHGLPEMECAVMMGLLDVEVNRQRGEELNMFNEQDIRTGNELKRKLKIVAGESEDGLDFVQLQRRRGRPKKIIKEDLDGKNEMMEKVERPEFEGVPSGEMEVTHVQEGNHAKEKRHRRKSIPRSNFVSSYLLQELMLQPTQSGILRYDAKHNYKTQTGPPVGSRKSKTKMPL
ncbi:hypothetical protein ZIOFF_011205 [Zingiber officinale]|uniref:Uncharacterized protein n=1 Tax=Zingiber officinale TaxID=94328 RepID=A0A8J5HQR5_ZINOF|nr:hypothetical protein ZIOFF_011205 [Zingiber officinale]